MASVFRKIYNYFFSGTARTVTLRDLKLGTGRVGRKQGSIGKLTIKKSLPAVRQKSMLYQAAVRPSEAVANEPPYVSTIIFFDVEFVNNRDDDHPVEVKTVTASSTGEKSVFMTRLSASRHSVAVRCDCLSYYYVYQYYNNKVKALFGPPFPPYKRLTKTRPPVNRPKSIGYCKHIEALEKELRRKLVLTD